MPHELLWTLLFYEKEYLASTQWANFIPNYPIAVQEIKSLDMFFSYFDLANYIYLLSLHVHTTKQLLERKYLNKKMCGKKSCTYEI